MSSLDRAIAAGHQKMDGDIHAAITLYQGKIAARVIDVQQKIAVAESLDSQLPVEAEACPPAVEDILGTVQTEIARLSKRHKAAERVLLAFAARHGLSRPAVAPSVLETALTLSLLVFVEGGVNSAFFLNAHMSAGPLSALLVSVLISATNVAMSAAAGYWIGRYLDWGRLAIDGDNARFARKRALAHVQLAAFTAVAALFHLTVGLIRAQETLHSVNHSFAAYWQLLTTPESVFLVLIGSVMTLLAFHKGKHGFDDPYPGYGALQRSVDDLSAKVAVLHHDNCEAIEARFEKTQRDTVKHAAGTEKAFTHYNKAVTACHTSHRALQSLVSQAEGELRAHVAQMVTLFAVGAGVSGSLTADELDQLCTLQGATALEIPPYKHAPDACQFSAVLEHAKADALGRLGDLFIPSTTT